MVTNFLGIEYSKDRVKCALLSFNGKDYEITYLQDFESDNPNSSLEPLIKWKNEVLGEQKVKAVVSISESSIFLKELRIPSAKKEALDEAIYWELSSNSPLPPNQAIYEWTEIERSGTEVGVVAMAVRETTIEMLTEKLESAGIEVIAIEPSSISLARIAGSEYQKNTMLLLVGNKETDIVVLKNGKPVFSTTSDVALKRDKEKWKLNKTVSDAIAKNTGELISFWEEKNNSKIQQVLITGDLVDKYFGLAASINQFANVPVNIAKQKNIAGLRFSNLPKALINRFFISIGAVARFGGDVYAEVNLIPKAKRVQIAKTIAEQKKFDRLAVVNYMLGLFLAGLIIVSAFFMTLKISYGSGIKKLTGLVQSHQAQSLREEFHITNNYLAQIAVLSATQKDEGAKLRKLAEVAPQQIKLTKLTFINDKERTWALEGEGSREAILAYFEKIKNEAGAKKVSMLYSSLDNDLNSKFEIDLIW